MLDDPLKPSWEVALGVAVIATATGLFISAIVSPQLSWWQFSQWGAIIFALVWGGAMGWPLAIRARLAWDAGELARARMAVEVAKHNRDIAQFSHEKELIGRSIPAVAADGPTPQVVNNEPRYSTEWKNYWLEALEYSRAVGSVGYQKTKAFWGGDVVVWRENFARPFIRAGLIRPIQPGVETAFENGQSIDKAVWRVENGTGPAPLPWPPPVAFSGRSASTTAGNGLEMRETVAQTVEQT